ncbi:globin [Pedosphaera parvula Ellin514]|uniref:Globin n=2 Tax=Pedosphaera TaxID=1032526 RepID=B9XPB2_PEDPL|nr:globin [Pedosphaera parvula Ellin514]
MILAALATMFGCHSTPEKQNTSFFTSGSREADQRASQRMARDEQITGSGEGAGEKKVKKAEKKEDASTGATTNKAAQAEGKLALFDRLGGEKGITAIVEDATPRILQDPRVNFVRNDVKRGGFSFHRDQAVTWQATSENITMLKKHLVQFISLASGGPSKYEGKGMKSVHAGMNISNPEFDAAVGDIKASLDKLQIPNTEQKELLAIVESTRPEIVTVR